MDATAGAHVTTLILRRTTLVCACLGWACGGNHIEPADTPGTDALVAAVLTHVLTERPNRAEVACVETLRTTEEGWENASSVLLARLREDGLSVAQGRSAPSTRMPRRRPEAGGCTSRVSKRRRGTECGF